MTTLRVFAMRYRYELAALAGAIVILWQLLLPGYVLTLDLVFGNHFILPDFSKLGANNFTYTYLFHVADIVMPGWVLEKIVLVVLFFSLIYLPLRFYPFDRKYGQEWLAAFLFCFNPFVYERFLAGQWDVLASYACLFPLTAYLIRFLWDRSWRSILLAYLWLFIDGLFALHLLVAGSGIVAVFALAGFVETLSRKNWAGFRKLFVRLLCGGLLLLVASSYWLVPALVLAPKTLASFTPEQWVAFETASDPVIGTTGNVAALYGFWGESYVWAQQFWFPKEDRIEWYLLGCALALVIVCGAAVALKRREYRIPTLALLVCGSCALVFSSGVGAGPFQPFNIWLFEHVPFWSGFRDSEKWSAVLALSYAIFFGIGGGWIVQRLRTKDVRIAASVALCTLAVAYMPTMLFGFAGQLQPVWYPQAWADANAYLAQQQDCTAVFLPWHEYYQPTFTDGILIGNPAKSYFDCAITSGQNIELNGVGTPSGLSPSYYAIEQVVEDNNIDPNAAVDVLKAEGIKYIIYTDDLARVDQYTYPLLRSPELSLVYKGQGIDIYKVAL